MAEDNMSPDELAEFSQYITQDSNEIEFEVTRHPHDQTFEEDAMKKLFSDIKTFVAARVMGRWPMTGEPPQKIRVKISLEIY